jgi:hypothetical protein
MNPLGETLSNLVSGAATILDWHHQGFKAVAAPVAQNRCNVCTHADNGNPCPFNKKVGYTLPPFAALILKKQLERKNEMALKLEGETGIGVCMVCNCILALKVWSPKELLLSQMSDELMMKFGNEAPWCWVNELKTN